MAPLPLHVQAEALGAVEEPDAILRIHLVRQYDLPSYDHRQMEELEVDYAFESV